MNYPFSAKLFSSPFFYLLVLADVILRGIALYKSARRDQRVWFVFLLIVNSVGILPLIYLFAHKDISLQSKQEKVTKKSQKKAKN